MFPSSRLFADSSCPLSDGGLCERPHCWYRHGTGRRDMFDRVQAAGDQNGYSHAVCGAAASDVTRNVCLQELERISKEIETVTHEVEQEQRRLSRYRTVQADGRNAAPPPSVSKSDTAGKTVDVSYGLSSSANFTKRRTKKYVVDNSKPRTDLEYDPLSNFSAGLRSHSSAGKEHKVKNEQGLKRARDAAPCDKKKPDTYQAPLSRSPSPEPPDDSDEVGDLIIKIPPSPDKKRGRTENHSDSAAGQSLQVNGRVIDLTGCLEDVGSESRAAETVEEAGPRATAYQQDKNGNDLVAEKEEDTFQVELPPCELPESVEKMNPLQPHHLSPKNSLFYKPPAANSDSPSRQHTKQAQKTEQPAQNSLSNQRSSTKCVPHSQKTSSETPAQVEGKAAVHHAAPETYLLLAERVPGSSQGQALWSSSTTRAESSTSNEQLLVTADTGELIIIESSSDGEEELNYSESEISDSDPMEECYRIFMEANEDKGPGEQPDVSVGAVNVEKPEVNVKPQALLGKRVAHEAKHTEPVAKSRPQPQVLVPLRGPAVSGVPSQPSATSKIQQIQQRAPILTASTSQRKPETLTAPSPSPQTPNNLQPAPVQNAYINYIPLGTAVIGVGNNLHLILPEGAFPLPVTAASSPVTSMLTPIGQVHTSAVAVRQMYCPPAVTPVQRYRATAPVLIPAPARKPSQTSPFASAHSNPAAPTAPQAAVKPGPTKRKVKRQCEAAKEKVPHDLRQHYINMFTEEFLKTTADVNEAFEKALAEERTLYNRSVNKLKYQSVAVNALKRLKSQSAVAAKDKNEVNSQRCKGNIPLNLKKLKENDDLALYESLKDYILTEEKMIESNYPVQHPEKAGSAVLFADNKKVNADALKRICCRCGAMYSVSQTGKHTRKEECNYHYGKGVKNKVPGGVETRYSCCEGVMGAPGCQVFKLHVHDSLSMDGFVSTVPRPPSDTSCPGVYSLDCEMCYTIHGLELSRVTVVNSNLRVVYDTFIRPDNEVIDYNTRFSGISEEDVKSNCASLRKVQETLLSFISADTILIGHDLETDLCVLKLLHGMVVDTSVVFPHRLGPPHKLTLKNLTAEYLWRIIQESVGGHDTAEDAAACMELMLWKVKQDGKLKK